MNECNVKQQLKRYVVHSGAGRVGASMITVMLRESFSTGHRLQCGQRSCGFAEAEGEPKLLVDLLCIWDVEE